MNPIETRLARATDMTERAAKSALGLFNERDKLLVESKGLQDWVSNADKSVELELRAAIADSFPDDAVIGEEHDNVDGSSGYTWVIDPIDGTTNFVTGTPGWCVVLACVHDAQCVCSVICDPIVGETFTAIRGGGTKLNGKHMQTSTATLLNEGTLGVGHSTRVPAQTTLALLGALLPQGGLFRRSGSGALDLAYVAAGRLIGFTEPHMNAWDCLAALLMIEEAGGRVESFDMQTMLDEGGQVVAACEGVYEQVSTMASQAYRLDANG